MRVGDLLAAGFFFAAILGLPLLGVVLAGEPVHKYTEFPPLTRYVPHAGFSWPVFVSLGFLFVAGMLAFDVRVFVARRRVPNAPAARGAFPWWGYAGLLTGGVTWVLAWTRLGWFAPFQRFPFSLLWFSYILVVNAWTYRRTGHCMLRDRPAYFVLLFPVSAAFWWAFEYLNRFVQNWYYVGVAGLSARQYFLLATLPFCTVLPAVLGTHDLLASVPRAGAGLDDVVEVKIPYPRLLATVALTAACAGLVGVGLWPDYMFPLLWVAPLFLITSLQRLAGRRTVFSGVEQGHWRRIYLMAMSALICGFFWEMWNFLSLAKWMYAVPFVSRFRVFEMPVLGYAGYLPFGLECAVIADIVAGLVSRPCSESGVARAA